MKTAEGDYHKGKQTGFWQTYKDGVLEWEGKYDEGVKVGNWIRFDADGREIQVMEYGE